MNIPGTGHDGLLIRGGRVIDPARGLDATGDIIIEGGVIGASAPRGKYAVLEADGLIVAPGLIDIHVHLREPGGEHKETIATGTAAAAAGGFTTVACMPNTNPALDSVERVAWVCRRAAETAACRVWPVAAVTVGRRGERLVDFAALKQAGAVAFSDDGCGVADDRVMRAAMEEARRVGAVLIQHCEDPALAAGGVMHAGPVAERLGLPGIHPRAEEAMIERDLALVRQTGARYHAAHISTAASVELVRRAKAEALPVTAEVCPHHLLLCDEDVARSNADANYKMNPPLRSRHDVAACIAGLLDGTIDCIVTDHAPHTAEEKKAGFLKAPFGVVGLETAVALAWRVLTEAGRADWSTLIRLMSAAPAHVLGRPLPSLAAGEAADIVLLDPNARWTIDPSKSASKSRNTPFAEWALVGRVVTTFVRGSRRFDVAADRLHG